MNKIFEKLKAINWKSKKTIIAYAVIFAILVGGTGTGLALNHFNNSSNIVKTNVKDTSKPADDKKEDEKSDDKKDTDKKDENSKPTDKTDDKKQETSKTDDKKTNSSSTNKNQNTPVNNNNSNSNNNTGNSSNNDNNTTPTPPTNNGGGNSGNNSTPTPHPPAHQHSWVPDIEYIKHDEVWHMEDRPIYETKPREICNDCEKDITDIDISEHIYQHMLEGGKGSHRTEYVPVIVGSEPVKVVDQEEWTETIDKGEKCSTCGAKK